MARRVCYPWRMQQQEKRGLPIVLLPGLDGDADLRAEIVARLSRSRPVTCVAYPADRALGYGELTDHVSACLPKGRCVLLAESFGGPIAIKLAASRKTISGLVLAGSFARHPLPSFLSWFAAFDPRLLPKRVVSRVLLGRDSQPELASRLHASLSKLPRDVLSARLRSVLTVDCRSTLQQIACPILCLQGRRDLLLNEKTAGEMIAGRPERTVEWMDASHMILETKPDVSADYIEAFCDHVA